MDFIMVPLIVGIICAGIYGLFELYARRKERLAIIEKLGDRLPVSGIDNHLSFPNYVGIKFSFNSLKLGCLLTGVGLGLLVGFFLSVIMGDLIREWHNSYQVVNVVYGASVLLFGGLGLLSAFVIEMRIARKKEKE